MISTHTSIHYSGMYTSSYTLYASRGSKCAPSCFDFPGLLNIESYDTTPAFDSINLTLLIIHLCDLIRLNVKSTTIRTRASFDHCVLCVPPISKTCANSFFVRSFVYAAPTLWNAIDLDIRLLPFDALKKKSQDTSLSEVLCKLILIVFILFV